MNDHAKLHRCCLVILTMMLLVLSYSAASAGGTDNVIINVDNEIYCPSNLPEYIAEKLIYEETDWERIAQTFFGKRAYSTILHRAPGSEDSKYGLGVYRADDKELSVYGNGIIEYASDNALYVTQIISEMDTYPIKELGFMTQAEAEQQCIELAECLGLSCQIKEVYALECATLMALADEVYPELKPFADLGKEVRMKEDWTESDECYYVKLSYAVNGTPYMQENYYDTSTDTFFEGCAIEALVSANGVEYFSASYMPKIIEAARESSVHSFTEAKQALIDIYSGLLMRNPIEIDGAHLEYVATYEEGYSPAEKFRLVPAWTFERRYEAEDRVTHINMYINAITLEEIGK